MTIRVTQDHIDRGRQSNCALCPVALALQEALGDPLIRAGVSRWGHFKDNEGAFDWSLPLPGAVGRFIVLFDACRGGEPFEFEIDKPEGT